ncbi:MAG: hypothetical protein Q4G30_00370 [Actinomycetaceae bacterium]|nr:hypothetical protein [Actinomycetaceae bacterium]
MTLTDVAYTKRIAMIHGGSYPQLATLKDPALAAFDVRGIYALDMTQASLDDVDSLIIADRLHPRALEAVKDAVARFAQNPEHKLVFFGEDTPVLLSGSGGAGGAGGLEWNTAPTNFWAWRTGDDVGIRLVNTTNPMWAYFNHASVHWHFHGSYVVPKDAVSLVDYEPVEGDDPAAKSGSIMYFDGHSYPAPMLVTTMDPVFHHGAGFMPGATQLLYRCLRWLEA